MILEKTLGLNFVHEIRVIFPILDIKMTRKIYVGRDLFFKL